MTIDEAAEELGVPKRSLQGAAERHGFLIRVGRAIRIDPADFPAFIAACKVKPSAPISQPLPYSPGARTISISHTKRAQDAISRIKELDKEAHRKRAADIKAERTALRDKPR